MEQQLRRLTVRVSRTKGDSQPHFGVCRTNTLSSLGSSLFFNETPHTGRNGLSALPLGVFVWFSLLDVTNSCKCRAYHSCISFLAHCRRKKYCVFCKSCIYCAESTVDLNTCHSEISVLTGAFGN